MNGLDRSALIVDFRSIERPSSLLIVIHGAGGTPERFEKETGFSDELASGVVVYPAAVDGTWNAGRCCLDAVERGIDDVAFIRAIIDTLVRDGTADSERVFLAGFSNGGMLAHAVGCHHPDLVAGVASVAGSIAMTCGGDRPERVLVVHGTADPLVVVGGHVSTDRPFSYASLWSMIGDYASALGCESSLKEPARDNISTVVWSPCTNGDRLQVTLVLEGKHGWPGDRTTDDHSPFDATLEIGRFFELRATL